VTEWTILETLAVRVTGFPLELLERLRFRRAAGLVGEIVAVEAARDRLRRTLLAESFPAAVARVAGASADRALLGRLSGWRRAIGGGRLVRLVPPAPAELADLAAMLDRWNELLDRHTALLATARLAWQEELDAGRAALREIAASPRVQEAILLSSPAMHTALERYLGGAAGARRSSELRRFDRRLAFYLQRLCAKNETNSFFGPINYGRIDPTQATNLRLRRSAEPLRRRAVFPTHWLAERLAAALAADPALRRFQTPRRHPASRAGPGSSLIFPTTGRSLALDPTLTRLYELADGRRTVDELAGRLAEDWPVTWSRVEQLGRAGALVAALVVPGSLADPLAYLEEWLTALPADLAARAHWLAVLRQLREPIAAFAAADLPTRVRLLAEIEARVGALGGDAAVRRGAGSMYADRGPLFEECLGDLEECSLGGELAAAIEHRLQPILRLWEAHGRLRAERDQRLARTLWQRLSPPGDQRYPFLAYLRALQADPPRYAGESDRLADFVGRVGALVQARSDGRVATLRGEELPIPPLRRDPDACACGSFDLMVAAPSAAALQAGEFELVLGEGHPQPLLWVFPTAYFLGDARVALGEALRVALARQPGFGAAAQLAHARKNKIFPYALPGATIELRPQCAVDGAIPAAAVEVRDVGGELRLAAGDRRLRLYAPLTRRAETLDPLAPFAFAPLLPLSIDLGEHTPRVVIDGVVYQRERWRVPGGSLVDGDGRDFDLFLAVWRWKERLALPREVFVRAPQEPKPVYVDFEDHFLVELLEQLARQSSALTIVEMLPSGQQLWLCAPDGRHCSEFRAVVVARPEGAEPHSVQEPDARRRDA
jgi:hypothetical protein